MYLITSKCSCDQCLMYVCLYCVTCCYLIGCCFYFLDHDYLTYCRDWSCQWMYPYGSLGIQSSLDSKYLTLVSLLSSQSKPRIVALCCEKNIQMCGKKWVVSDSLVKTGFLRAISNLCSLGILSPCIMFALMASDMNLFLALI